ncbi:uncharacterized protein E0L32_003038 [Thyridium curvatum]|uniref:Uncharacterized protein n=1 Tax=Thyridium curvatum TaxID=1093900 RepID=A0A507B2P2_9PEZI|nr:uncharacterized protein E0L32_003038 [Thyridium curvatum]TPX17395.1 hypothetical protein E0L32_003038 [Thyridium curvatum]
MLFHTLAPLALLLLSGGSLAAAAPAASPAAGGSSPAAKIIEQIMPKSASCDGAPAAGGGADCRTAAQAADFFVAGFQRWSVYAPAQIAAVLAVSALESDELRYKHNVSPGRPGQGTSNMQMIHYNLLYARAVPELRPKADAIAGGAAAAGESLPADKADAVLALVTPDEYNFASGAWFLATQCSADVRSQLATGSDAGWAAYMGCIGVPADDPARVKYWTAAKAAFNIS